MIKGTCFAGFFVAVVIVVGFVAPRLAGQTQAEKDRINAAEAAAARERAQKANPSGRFDSQVDAISKVTQSDINAAFTTKSDLDYFKKQEEWRKENQRRIDFENSPAGRAQAWADQQAAAAAMRKRWENSSGGGESLLQTAARFQQHTENIRHSALKIIEKSKAGDAHRFSGSDAEEAGALAETLLFGKEFHGRRFIELGLQLGSSGDESIKLAQKLYALAGGVSGREHGAFNPDHPNVHPVVPQDLLTPAMLLKGGHGDVVVRQARSLRAIAGADDRVKMQITLGLASALAMPKGDLSATQRTLAAELLAARLRENPPDAQQVVSLDDRHALRWMFLAAAEQSRELARAPSMAPYFFARPEGFWRSRVESPPSSDGESAVSPARGDWWNLASMIVLAEKTRYPSAWFAAIRAERRAKQQPPASPEVAAVVQRALDDWLVRNGALPDARRVLQADAALTCEASWGRLGNAQAWDNFLLSADASNSFELVVDGRMEILLASPLLKEAQRTARFDEFGVQRWLVDPRWQPGLKANLTTWRTWLELAGPAGILAVAERSPEHLRDAALFRRASDALRLTPDGELSPASRILASALLGHADAHTDPLAINTIAVLRGQCEGDWVGLSAWLADPRRRPKESDPWYDLYERANRERDQVAGKFEDFKLGPDADVGLCGRIETWLKDVLAAKGAVRAALLAECPSDLLVKPDLRILGYDVERGGFASRAMFLLVAPKFDPRLPVKNGGRYDPEPWLAAMAKLPATVSAEELAAQIAAAVNRAWTEKFEGNKALDSTFSIQAGVAAQRALGRLASRWSSAREPAQEEVLKLLFGVLLEGPGRPNPDCIEARIKWERALMKGLNAADAFAQASYGLGRPELAYLVAVGKSPSSLPPLVLSDDEHFFREARRALAELQR